MSSANQIIVGKIVAAQGLRGEVRVQTYTQNPADFATLKVKNEKLKDKEIKFVRTIPSSDVVIMKISGIDDRDAAESLRGTELFIDRGTLPALAPGEYYQTDLIGMKVIAPLGGLSRESATEGVVVAVQNYGAGDILELDNGEMVSFIGAKVDLEKREIILR